MATTLSYIIRGPQEEQGHRFGVNALTTNRNETVLLSAGRDGVVREWDITPEGREMTDDGRARPSYRQRRYDFHTNWVNDLALCEELDFLLTASSDHNLKIWDYRRCGLVATLQKHTDFVKAVSYAPETRSFVSAGLDRKLVFWDLQRKSVSSEYDDRNHPQSIYACVVNPTGRLVATGSTDKMIRLFDPRTKNKVGMLSGHGDMVKALAISADGRTVISGSSDQLVKVWDVSAFKCVGTLSLHSDSVWTVKTDRSFKRIYSGGRDGRVVETELSDGPIEESHSRVVCMPDRPVLSMAVTKKNLWVTTTDSDISCYPLGRYDQEAAEQVIPGLPGLVDHRILCDRRHVLTKDTHGNVAKWDMLTARKVEDCVGADFETAVKKDADITRLPSWCTVDTHVGLLTVTLSPGTAFKCRSLLRPNAVADESVNHGECIIQALLRPYQEISLAAQHRTAHPSDPRSEDDLEKYFRRVNLERQLTHNHFVVPNQTQFYFTIHTDGAPSVPAVFKPARIRLSMRKLQELIPEWIKACLFTEGAVSSMANTNVTFIMAACMGTPSLSRNRLTCFSYLPLWRISRFIYDDSTKVKTLLSEHLDPDPVPQGPSIFKHIPIFFEDEALDPFMHLAYISFKYGKRDKELELRFRLCLSDDTKPSSDVKQQKEAPTVTVQDAS